MVLETKTISASELRITAENLKKAGNRLVLVSGVDWVAKNQTFEVLYHFSESYGPAMTLLKVSVPFADPHIPSIADMYGLADWHERETYDLFGIVFDGHPNLKRIFLPDEFVGHPLRKEYQAYKRELPG